MDTFTANTSCCQWLLGSSTCTACSEAGSRFHKWRQTNRRQTSPSLEHPNQELMWVGTQGNAVLRPGNFALQRSRALNKRFLSGNTRSWALKSGLSARPSARCELVRIWKNDLSLHEFKVMSVCEAHVLTAVHCAFWSDTIGTLEALTVCQALRLSTETLPADIAHPKRKFSHLKILIVWHRRMQCDCDLSKISCFFTNVLVDCISAEF